MAEYSLQLLRPQGWGFQLVLMRLVWAPEGAKMQRSAFPRHSSSDMVLGAIFVLITFAATTAFAGTGAVQGKQ